MALTPQLPQSAVSLTDSKKREKACQQQTQLSPSTTLTTRRKVPLRRSNRPDDMKSLSIAGRGTHTGEHVVGYYNAGDRMKYWGKVGAFWGGFWGLLFGSALFAIPGIGPVLVAGPLVSWIVAGLEGAVVVGGVSALGAGLVSIGIPKDSVIKYEAALKTDKFLLIVHGSPDAVYSARFILDGSGTRNYCVHGQPMLTS